MRKPIAWHNASAADWEVARQREAVIRPLAAQPCLTPAIVSETARILNLRAESGLPARRTIPKASSDLHAASRSERTPARLTFP